MSHKISLGTCRTNRLRLVRVIYSASKEAELMSFAVQKLVSVHQPAENQNDMEGAEQWQENTEINTRSGAQKPVKGDVDMPSII